ncbi:TPA: hypothetical protein QCR51_004906 [Bacillus cereus]|nr:hypothetical protein [Bacillus cereus]
MTKTHMDLLDEIWDKALEDNICKCRNDDHWEQSLMGSIVCTKCKTTIWKIEHGLK